jgi:ADP-ribosylglycohydrolase
MNKNKVLEALVGVCIGDALGLAFEFLTQIKQIKKGTCYARAERTKDIGRRLFTYHVQKRK